MLLKGTMPGTDGAESDVERVASNDTGYTHRLISETETPCAASVNAYNTYKIIK